MILYTMDLSKEIYSALKMILLHVQGVISLTQLCSKSYHKNRYIFGNYWTTLCASNKIIKSRIHFFYIFRHHHEAVFVQGIFRYNSLNM